MRIRSNQYFMFYIPFVLYFMMSYMEYTTLIKINGVETLVSIGKGLSYIIAVLVCGIRVVQVRRYSIKYFFLAIVLFTFFTYMAIFQGRRNIFVALIMSLIFNEKYFTRFLRDYIKLASVALIVTIILSLVGVIDNIEGIRYKFGTTMNSYALGFSYHGQLMYMTIPILFTYYYLKGKKITFRDNIFWLIIILSMFAITKTIMPTFLGLLFITLDNILIKNKQFTNLLNKKWINYVPILFFLLTIMFLYLYKIGNSLGMGIDLISNGRYHLGVTIIDIYGVRLLGTEFENNSIDFYQYLDSEYMHMLVAEGILYTCFSIIVGIFIMKYTLKNHNSCARLIWILIFFNCMFNNGVYTLTMNPFCIMMIPSIRGLMKPKNRLNSELQKIDEIVSRKKEMV